MNSYKFPQDFVWGVATSAHQTEGNNKNSDWWAWEQNKPENRKWPLEPSGIACDSYNRYEEDFDLCKTLNSTAVRISIEWARIEPKPGYFDQKEINHYKKVLQAAKDRNLKTFVTLHHFTNPQWLVEQGGWPNRKSVTYFAEYAKKCAIEFQDLIDVFLTINEPQVYALVSYTAGMWPPSKHNPLLALKVQIHMMRAHKRAYDMIKAVCNKPVGIVKNIVWYETDPFGANIIDKLTAKTLYFLSDMFFLRPIVNKLDFIGLNYYFTNRIKHLKVQNPADYGSDLDWWINPMGLEEILHRLNHYKLPIYITENGLADAYDNLRSHFIDDMLGACANALDSGVDLKGYFHWSLIDNFEWHQGYWPRFGLVEIDRENNLARKPRKSFYYYADICKTGTLHRDY